MRRPDGGAGVSLFPAVRGYRRCLCGRLVTLFAVRGRPAVFCPPHQNGRDRWRLRRADRSQQ